MNLDLNELHPLATDPDLEVLETNEVGLAIIPVTNEVAGISSWWRKRAKLG